MYNVYVDSVAGRNVVYFNTERAYDASALANHFYDKGFKVCADLWADTVHDAMISPEVWERYGLAAYDRLPFDESDPATWGELPAGYVWHTVDPVTGETNLFAPDGRNVSGGPALGTFPPDGAVNAAILAAIRGQAYRPEFADSKWAQWHDMDPVVTQWWKGPTDPAYCPDDQWVIEVQYSSRGGRAVYGVDRNHVPTCYAD